MVAPRQRRSHIVALGSSFAAGPCIAPVVDALAGRSGNNYASILARKLDAKLTDLSVSGATTWNILSEAQDEHHPPQLDLFPTSPQLSRSESRSDEDEEVDIVTITIGGNDLGYIGQMVRNSIPSFASSLLLPSPEANTETVESVSDRFITITNRIREKAPNARVYMVEYLTVLDVHSGASTGFSKDQMDESRKMSDMVQAVYERTYSKMKFIDGVNKENDSGAGGVELVPARAMSMGHGVGSGDPWVDGFGWMDMIMKRKAPFHPNLRGMEMIAEELYKRVKAREGTKQ